MKHEVWINVCGRRKTYVVVVEVQVMVVVMVQVMNVVVVMVQMMVVIVVQVMFVVVVVVQVMVVVEVLKTIFRRVKVKLKKWRMNILQLKYTVLKIDSISCLSPAKIGGKSNDSCLVRRRASTCVPS